MTSWRSFEEMEVWKMARAFCVEVEGIGLNTGLKSDFSLKDQINRSSGSVMDNIAEGFERGGNKEFIYFLAIAKGSAGEARSQLYRILDKKYITKEEFDRLKTQSLNISGKLANLIKYLKSSNLEGIRKK